MSNSTIEESERRVKSGCIWVFVLLAAITAVGYAEYGVGLLTIVLTAMLLFTLLVLVVINRPQKKP